MRFHEMFEAMNEAERTLKLADEQSEKMARLLSGRLRMASRSYFGARAVADLKRELRDFNMQTCRWKS